MIYIFSVAFGNLRISGGGSSGKLEFQIYESDWGAVCLNGFSDATGDVTCAQLNLGQSQDVYC